MTVMQLFLMLHIYLVEKSIQLATGKTTLDIIQLALLLVASYS